MKTRDLVPKPAPTKLTTVRIPEDVLRAAKAKAQREGLDLSKVIVAGLRKYLKE